ncbi:MAG: hypothetical protein ETSY2_34475 [Candidatus Entotheonella gemina]|uniref:Uncharacterized protein n=1 Tax=Candidatus Entotheonella gemina TaxID=1429439 RepID=W4LZX5_9BACT|nr:MAG: hypothetical protein ETSY2_34475 [Candidatus Entotheonella gemina]
MKSKYLSHLKATLDDLDRRVTRTFECITSFDKKFEDYMAIS